MANAIGAKDVNALMANYAPDVQTFDLLAPQQHGGSDAIRKRVSEWFSSFQGPIGYEMGNLSITTGDGVGFCHSLTGSSGTRKDGTKVEMWWRATTAFRKIGGKWIVTHGHSSEPFDGNSGKALLELKPARATEVRQSPINLRTRSARNYKMPSANIPDLIRRYYGAYQSQDRQAIEQLLTDDFTFTSPYDDHIDKQLYSERCWPNSETSRTYTIEKLFEQGNGALVRYKAELNTGKAFRNTKLLGFNGNKIAEVDVYFGRTLKGDSKK